MATSHFGDVFSILGKSFWTPFYGADSKLENIAASAWLPYEPISHSNCLIPTFAVFYPEGSRRIPFGQDELIGWDDNLDCHPSCNVFWQFRDGRVESLPNDKQPYLGS